MKILVTAGPTREPIDPVRYLSNRSSGKMGFAIAAAAAAAGHEVILVSGPVSLVTPEQIQRVDVETAEDLYHAVESRIATVDIAIMAAAVADYRPARAAGEKIKKDGAAETLTLELVRTRDVLGSARGEMGFTGTLVGFAAETEDLEANAAKKLHRKGCDFVVANDVSVPGIGFDSDENAVLVLRQGAPTISLGKRSKERLAAEIIELCSAAR
ncbi:MAG: phosphopantothenoylcysteine decarboxylase [Verrucomicrobiales bacterium]